jgi:hypothetical protein
MLVLESKNLLCRLWKLLLDTLVWSGLVEVQDIGLEEAVELFLVQDQEMIQAFSPHAPSKAFTDGIRLWRSIRSSKHLDATCCRHSCEILAKFSIIIANQICWCVSIRSRFPQRYAQPKDR